MTTWTRVVYCERTARGEVFTVLERAKGSQQIRRPAVIHHNEEEARRVLAALGETPEAIQALIAAARGRTDDGLLAMP